MATLFFDETKYAVYNAIKWASENSSDEKTRYICSRILAGSRRPSAFGYIIKVNELWATCIINAQAEYLLHIQNSTSRV